MLLQLQRLVYVRHNTRSMLDRRHVVTLVIAEYTSSAGLAYRKAFERKGKRPLVPEEGTSEQLNDMRKQW